MVGYGWRFGEAAGLWWLLGLVCVVVLVGAIAWLVVAATRGSRHASQPQTWQPPYPGTPVAPPRPTPHEILRERLARGEISVEDFERTKAALGPDPSQPLPPQAPQG